MKPSYRVRFRPSKDLTVPHHQAHRALTLPDQHPSTHKIKSKDGCRECRRRRVKCDESFPVCLRCQRAGTECRLEPRVPKWRLELPGITIPRAPDVLSTFGSHVDRRLLQYWLEKTSQVMVLNPDINPLSYPILQLLGHSPWIASILQSISAAYEKDFERPALHDSLLHRQKALTSFRHEVTSPDSPLAPKLLSSFLLGVSSCWIDGTTGNFGKEHLLGGRAVLEMMLLPGNREENALKEFALGTYIYWDMSCSLLVDPCEQMPLNTPTILSAVKDMSGSYHPMSGHAIELFHLLGTVGRHCRTVIDTGVCDVALEATLEKQLLEWDSALGDNEVIMLGEAFRKHGLILLYRICGIPHNIDLDCDPYDYIENTIHQLALDGLKALMCTPTGSGNFAMQPIPLLTMGSELNEKDVKEREEILSRFRTLHSINRTPVNLWAIQLLKEHWELRKEWIFESFVSLMLRKGWKLTMG